MTKKFICKICNKIGNKVYACVNKNLQFIFAVALFGIVFAVIGHYGTMSFNLKWFLFFELPLYAFLIWAVCSVWRTYSNFKNKSKNNG